MEETAYIEEVQQEPQQQPDPPRKRLWNLMRKRELYTKSYEDFDKQFSTPESIGRLHKFLGDRQLYTKTTEDFQNQFFSDRQPSKKKEPTPLPASDGKLPSQENDIPIVTDYGNGEIVNPKDPFAMVKAANEFSKRTQDIGVTGEYSEVVPDEKSVKASVEINKDLDKQGFKPDFSIAVNDLPDDVFNDKSKETLSALYKENSLKFKQLTNELKNRHAVRQGAYDIANENIPEGNDKEYLARQQAIIEGNDYNINEVATPETMNEFRGMMAVKQNSINRNIRNVDEKKKMQGRLRDTYSSVINADSLNLKEEYDNSDVKGLVDINQYAGLETLRIFDPAKYENYKRIIQQKITPLYSVEVNVTPEEKQRINTPDSVFAAKNKGTVSPLTISEQIGQETVLRELNAIGLGNAAEQLYSERSDIIAAQNKMIKESERKDITPEELSVLKFQFDEATQRINGIQSQIAGLEKSEKDDDARYTQTAQLKFDAQVKEMVKDDGESVGAFMWNKFGHSMGSSVDAIESLLVSNFGSKDDKAALSMRRIGEQQKFDAKTYLPENERRINSPVIMEFDEGLKKEINKVLNGRELGELSETERKQLIDLVSKNQDKIKTITNPEAGKSKNFWSKATVMTVAGFTSEITAFMAKMALLRGAGVGAKTAEAEVLFMDGYNHSVQQKLAEGASMDEANEYGILHGAILSTMVKFGSKFEAVKKIMAGGKSPLSKQIAGMSEETWNAIYNKNKSFIQRLSKSAKGVAGEQVKMIGTFAGIAPTADAVADNVFYNADNTVGEIAHTVVEGSIDMAIGGLPLIGFGLARGSMKHKATPLEKAALWNLGDQPTIGKLKIDEAVQRGELTLEEGEANKKTIDNVSKLIQKVPTKTDKNKLMTDEQRMSYLLNLTVQENAKQEAKDLPPKQAEKADHKAKVADYENQIILDTPTTEKLESQKSGIEKKLEQKDEEGKFVLPEKERLDYEAELEAVNNELETRKSFKKTEIERRDITPKEPVPPPNKESIAEPAGSVGVGGDVVTQETDLREYKSDAKGTEELAKDLDEKLQGLGLKQERGYSKSENDFGESYYIVIYDKEGKQIKFRVSDHSVTNVARMANEVHISNENIGEKITDVEKRLFPERFESGIKTMDIREDYLMPTDKVVGEKGFFNNTNKKILTVEREVENLNKKKSLSSNTPSKPEAKAGSVGVGGDVRKGDKQFKKAFSELNEAKTPQEKLNAINTIRRNEKAGGILTDAEKKKIDEVEKGLKEEGYETPNLYGISYHEGMRLEVINAKEDNTLADGEVVITKVVSPQINKDGKMIQAAKVEVTVGTKEGGLSRNEWLSEQKNKSQPKAETPTPTQEAGSVGVGGDVVDNKTKQQLLDERLNKIKEIKDKAEGTREERTNRYKELVNEFGDETVALKKLQEEINAKAKKEIDKLPELPKTENEIVNEKGESDFEKIKKDLGFKSNDYSWGKSPMDEDMGDMLLSRDKESVIFIKPNEVEVYDEKNDQTDTIINGVKIELVSTKENSRGKGKAKEMVQKVTDWADKNNADLHLDIAPQDKSTTESGLKKLYESFGFEFDGIHGIRKPKAVEQSLKEQPKAGTSQAEKVAELEAERDMAILREGKPKIDLDLLPESKVKKLGIEKIAEHDDIEDRLNSVKRLIDCLWKIAK